jgi:hypothetical protein
VLDKLLSSLGRLVHAPEHAGPGATAEAERRVWLRYPSSAQVSCHGAGEPEGENLSARVVNISRGGIGLVVDREMEVGRFLSVELPAPSPEGVSRVLAYILHVTPQPDGQWAVGCSFSVELNDDDLRAFGARRLRPAAEDQRAWVRFPCPVRATYQVIRGTESPARPACVTDISPVGVGLQVNQPVEVGTLLSIELRGTGSAPPLTILASVVRSTAQPAGEWMLGCHFIRELTEAEMQSLL